MKIRPIILCILAICTSARSSAQQPAFPGAQGWGRYAQGGRYGKVYHVTNLNDSGTGSLRDAVSQPNRIVVFDVAGVINIDSRIVFAKNLYVAGQTAPGEGITVYGDGVSFSGASNTIVRYMRFRMGHKGTSGKDAAGIANGTNMIFDHCSFSWGLDETFSINPDGKGDLHSITIQNCIVGQGLMTHSAGGLMQADSISLYRNFYCDNSTRNNKVKGVNQFVNNLIYNWSNGAYIMGGDSEGQSYCNIEGNLFINGPAVGGAAFTGGNSNFHFYGDDNWQDSNIDGVFDPSVVTDYSASDRQDSPYDYPALDRWAGNLLVDSLLPSVGASLPYRDYADCYMIDEVKSFGTEGALISNEENLPFGAPDTWTVWKGNERTDSDGDGMPDEWEMANGTDPSADDAMIIAANGYAYIENYINSLDTDNRDFFIRPPMLLVQSKSTTTTIKISWSDYTDNEDGFSIEMLTDEGFKEIGTTPENATSYTAENLEPATAYTFRMRAFDKAGNYSEFTSEYTFTTRPVEVGIIDIDTYEADYIWNKDIDAWDFTSAEWNDGSTTYKDGGKVLFAPTENAAVKLDETVSPASVVINADADFEISGEGSISGEGTSVNKAGEGTLTLSTENNYTGATVLHGGTIEFASLKNGGQASAIGASMAFAQNWIMDGGTYKYTGESTSTDRCAKLLQPTVLYIDQSDAQITAKGSFEGTSDFILDGDGQLTVGSKNFFGYSGKTILRGGKLYLSTVDIAKNGIGSSKQLVMEGGHLATAGETNGYETYSFDMDIVEGSVSQFSPNRLCYFNSKLTGAGTLQINIPYLREYIQCDFSGFTGRIIANGISTDSWGSLFLLGKSESDLSSCVVETKGNAKVCSWATNATIKLGGLSGSAGTYLMGSSKNTDGFTCNWTVGFANTDETFAGIINNNACAKGHEGTVSINKVGTGLWRLTGNNVYSGGTNVQAGTLVVDGIHSGKGKVNVTSNATLAGKGSIAGNVVIYNGGTVHAGDTLINAHTLTLNGGLTIKEGATVDVPLFSDGSRAKCNKIKVVGDMNIDNATLSLDMSGVSRIKDNQVFVVFDVSNANVSGSGFTTIDPAVPSPTQVWDTSQLLEKGYLYVRSSDTAIREITVDRESTPYYNMGGQKIAFPEKGRLYIHNGEKILYR